MAEDGTSAEIKAERDANAKRQSYIDWDEYFMAIAFLTAKRSKDPSTQVGACIVNEDKRIVGIGYNGMPTGCSDDEFPWTKNSGNPLESKYLYVCHAEVNAILNKNSSDVKNCTIYVGLFPCNECAKVIIQSGIKTVVYMSDKHAHKVETIAAKKMFDATGIQYRGSPFKRFCGTQCVHVCYARNESVHNVAVALHCTILQSIITSIYFRRQYVPRSKKLVIDFTEINWNEMTQLPPTPMKYAP